MATKQQDVPDYNFCFPLDLSKLSNDRLSLIPFESDLPHFSTLYVKHSNQPDALLNFRYLPYGPFTTVAEFSEFYNRLIKPDRGTVWFAIITKGEGSDLQGAGRYAGTIGILNADTDHARAEVGHINILPAFQRTFVGSHANGLLLHYLLDPLSTGCLGLRRVQWFANASNERSINAAKRLGYHFEGVLRWHRVLPERKEGIADGTEKEIGDGRGPARHSALLSLCWDDWRAGAREKVDSLMQR